MNGPCSRSVADYVLKSIERRSITQFERILMKYLEQPQREQSKNTKTVTSTKPSENKEKKKRRKKE